MKKLFRKIRELFSDKTDTWDNQPPNLPVRRLPDGHRTPSDNQTSPPRGFSPFKWREQMMENEFAAQNCTRENQSVNVFGPSAGGNIPCSYNNETFTEDGLVSGKTEAFLTTADGRLIRPNELHGGGKCFNCMALTDKIYFCAVCKIPLCFHCARKYKDIDVCHKHLAELNFNEDTWSVENE
ncbi:MAG: hypothetical protein PHH77_04360 [Victivallaceae bacterium]|nr:hypothetical protein [Victivallaceae bacterium]